MMLKEERFKMIKKLKQKRMNFKSERGFQNKPSIFRKDSGVIDLLHPQEGVTNKEVEDLW